MLKGLWFQELRTFSKIRSLCVGGGEGAQSGNIETSEQSHDWRTRDIKPACSAPLGTQAL